MPTVSVLMATYNGAQHLRAQLESIRQQTHAPHELWVADDGSTDDTRQIVAEFAERVSFPVRLRLNTQSQGYSENFLSATLLCEGDFIAFCDQNDEWHPEKLERCIGALEREDALLCVHTATLIDAQSHDRGPFPPSPCRRGGLFWE
jgi:glycosyltransferase involved in cell wall biosynthesis